jgi:RNA polymerase sigma-70 factor (ECF subfamily)
VAIDTGELEDAIEVALVVAFQAGDQAAFTEIVATYHPMLLSRARRQLRSEDDAQDAVQETLLRAYRYLPSFAGQYRLAAWLNRILSNVIADAKRQRGVEVRLHLRLAGVREEERVTEELIAHSVEEEDVRVAVLGAIACLSEAHRQAFVLREVEDQSYAEIAQHLDITEINARARVHRARASLQRSLGSINGSAGVVLVAWRGHFARFLTRPLGRSTGTPKTGASSLAANSPLATGSPATPGFGVSQIVTQTLATPTGQALSVIASETGRSLIPSGGMLASILSTTAIAVVAPASVLLAPLVSATTESPAAAHAITASAMQVATAPVQGPTISLGDPAVSAARVTMKSGATIAPASPAVAAPAAATKSTSTPSAAGSPTAGSPAGGGTAASTPSNSWSWVTTASTAGPTSFSATPTSVACPYLESFPDESPTEVTLPPAESNDQNASSFLSTGTVATPSTGPYFDAAGSGTYSSGTQSAAMNVLFGACLASTSAPALVANVDSSSPDAVGEVQLRGALVSTTTGDGETDTYYRGTAAWLSGPSVNSAPVEFVADVVTTEPNSTAMLFVAFFGSLDDLLGPSAQPTTASTTSAATTPTGTSTSPPSTSTTSSGGQSTAAASGQSETPPTPQSTTTSASAPAGADAPGGATDASSDAGTSSGPTTHNAIGSRGSSP